MGHGWVGVVKAPLLYLWLLRGAGGRGRSNDGTGGAEVGCGCGESNRWFGVIEEVGDGGGGLLVAVVAEGLGGGGADAYIFVRERADQLVMDGLGLRL